ncbi:MAG: hypothetical protein A2X77_02330 [Gammaproteobacteria bacterium GWE2_42_36]|nr:MAG: hypothetical protein A2X77_02330 [Gammaproteobacteria bacterium GWE2_42_36]
MLQFIREKSQGWIASVIVIGVCIPFILWGVKSYLYGQSNEALVATVNGNKITQRDFLFFYNQYKQQQRMDQPDSEMAVNTTALKEAALQSMISNLTLTQDATGHGFVAAPELIDATLAKIPIFQVNGVFSSIRFEEILSRMLYTPETFFQQLSNKILVNQVKSGFVDTAFVLPSEINRSIALVNQWRDFDYLIVPKNRFLSKVTVSNQAIKDYYGQHPEAFKTIEKASFDYIRLSLNDLVQSIQPTPAQLQDFYQTNITAYTVPRQWQVQYISLPIPMQETPKQLAAVDQSIKTITQQIKTGVDFVKLIQQYSDDKSTAVNEKQLAWINAGQVTDIVRDALMKMKVGDISMPIRTSQGYQILKVVNVKPEKVMPFSQVKDKIMLAYRQQKAEQTFANLNDKLANLTYETPNSLTSAATTLNLKVQTTDLLTRQGGNDSFTKDARILQAAFSDDVIIQHNNSAPINLDENTVVVLRLHQYEPAQIKPFDQVKADITRLLQDQAAKAQAESAGQQILVNLKIGTLPKTDASGFPLSWQSKRNIKSRDKTVPSEILMVAFRMARPSKVPTQKGLSLASGDYAIIRLNQVQTILPGTVDHPKQQAFTESMSNGYGNLDYNFYAEGLSNKAKVKRYASLDATQSDPSNDGA